MLLQPCTATASRVVAAQQPGWPHNKNTGMRDGEADRVRQNRLHFDEQHFASATQHTVDRTLQHGATPLGVLPTSSGIEGLRRK